MPNEYTLSWKKEAVFRGMSEINKLKLLKFRHITLHYSYTHPSTITQPGIELATCWSQVRRPSHYTTSHSPSALKGTAQTPLHRFVVGLLHNSLYNKSTANRRDGVWTLMTQQMRMMIVRLRSFRSISSQRRTSFTNFLWNALTLGFSCRHQKQCTLQCTYTGWPNKNGTIFYMP